MINSVDPLIAALIGALGGILLGGLGVTLAVRSRIPVRPTPSELPPDDLDAIVQAIRGGAAVIGPNDELVCANEAARSLGLIRGTRVGIPAVHDLIRQARTEGEVLPVNLEHKRGGVAPTLQLAARVVPLPQGLTLVVVDDRAPALRVQASSRDFLANATHELKTPIGAISLLAEAVEGASDDPEAVARFAGKIQAEAARLSVLVGQFITLSRLRGLDPVVTAQPVEVDAVVRRALERCHQLADRRGISLHSGGTTDLWVEGDAEQLETAVTNLVQNAVSHSGDRGRGGGGTPPGGPPPRGGHAPARAATRGRSRTASSSASTASTSHAAARPAARVWASVSSRRSPRGTGATSPCGADRAAVPRSPCDSPPSPHLPTRRSLPWPSS